MDSSCSSLDRALDHGFSNRLNTILVPQTFMDWANTRYAPGKQPRPSRLIVEVNNPADPAINRYFDEKGYETEGDALDAGKATYFLRLITSVVIAIGLLISLLAFYILMLSIFLLLQKNSEKLHNLLLIGYTPTQAGTPYYLLSIVLNLSVWILAVGCVALSRHAYLGFLQKFLPQLPDSSCIPCVLTGFVLAVAVSTLHVFVIRNQLKKIGGMR